MRVAHLHARRVRKNVARDGEEQPRVAVHAPRVAEGGERGLARKGAREEAAHCAVGQGELWEPMGRGRRCAEGRGIEAAHHQRHGHKNERGPRAPRQSRRIRGRQRRGVSGVEDYDRVAEAVVEKAVQRRERRDDLVHSVAADEVNDGGRDARASSSGNTRR